MNKEYPYNFVADVQNFTASLMRNFGPNVGGEIEIHLSPRLYDIAWREALDRYPYNRYSIDKPSKLVNMYFYDVTVVLKPIEDKETE